MVEKTTEITITTVEETTEQAIVAVAEGGEEVVATTKKSAVTLKKRLSGRVIKMGGIIQVSHNTSCH
jgi:hypothetical protein